MQLLLIPEVLHAILNPLRRDFFDRIELGARIARFHNHFVDINNNLLFVGDNGRCKLLQVELLFSVFKLLTSVSILWLHFAHGFEVIHGIFELAHGEVRLSTAVVALHVCLVVFDGLAGVKESHRKIFKFQVSKGAIAEID